MKRAHDFKESNEGKMLLKEFKDLKMAVKKNLKITDLPENSDDEEEFEDLQAMLKIDISKDGEQDIKQEVNDVK